MGRWRLAIAASGVALLAALMWLVTTDDGRVWPVRNTVQYRVFHWWWARAGPPESGLPGTLRGVVRDAQGRPIAGARALVSRWDGTIYSATTAADGSYVISGIPAGQYAPVAG